LDRLERSSRAARRGAFAFLPDWRGRSAKGGGVPARGFSAGVSIHGEEKDSAGQRKTGDNNNIIL
jgi:hypothetical protein